MFKRQHCPIQKCDKIITKAGNYQEVVKHAFGDPPR